MPLHAPASVPLMLEPIMVQCFQVELYWHSDAAEGVLVLMTILVVHSV